MSGSLQKCCTGRPSILSPLSKVLLRKKGNSSLLTRRFVSFNLASGDEGLSDSNDRDGILFSRFYLDSEGIRYMEGEHMGDRDILWVLYSNRIVPEWITG